MAERRAQIPETSEHNTESKATPSTPDNRPKAKAKTGPSPKTNLPPFPTGEKAPGSQDKPKNNNPESDHEPKGNPGRQRNTQGPKSNNQGPPPARKDNKEKPKANPIPTPNPKHDTDVDNNIDFYYWKDQYLAKIKDQLNKRGFRKHRNPDGSRMNKPHYLAGLR